MNASQTAVFSGTYSSSIYRHGYFAERGALYFLRGVAAAMLLPLEILQHLSKGNKVDRKTRFSWILLLAVLLALGAVLFLSLSSSAQGVDHRGILSAFCVVALVAGIGSGKMRKSIKHHGSEVRSKHGSEQGHKSHGHHSGHRGGHGERGRGTGRPEFAEHGTATVVSQLMKSSPKRETLVPEPKPAPEPELETPPSSEDASSQSSAQSSGVCINDCKECGESVCVRSGAKRNRRSK